MHQCIHEFMGMSCVCAAVLFFAAFRHVNGRLGRAGKGWGKEKETLSAQIDDYLLVFCCIYYVGVSFSHKNMG